MKKLFILWMAAVALCSCEERKSDKNAFTVEGMISVKDMNGKTCFLQKLDEETGEIVVLDSIVIKAGTFIFKGTVDTARIGMLRINDADFRGDMPVVLEPGKINVSLSSDFVFTRSGTILNDTLQSLYDRRNLIEKKYDEIMKSVSKSDSISDQTVDLNAIRYERSNESRDLLTSFIKSNINNPVGKYFGIIYFDSFDIETQEELLNLADAGFKSNEEIQALLTDLNEAKKMIGMPFKNVTLTDPKEKKMSLSDYAGKGKYVLVHFWASWCPPCRKNMPHLVSLYDKYKGKDFEIVGISLDDDKTQWKKAIKDLQMTWPQLSDLKGWNSEAARIYNVNSIPNVLIIDKEGKIISLNPHGTRLDKKLEELLK